MTAEVTPCSDDGPAMLRLWWGEWLVTGGHERVERVMLGAGLTPCLLWAIAGEDMSSEMTQM